MSVHDVLPNIISEQELWNGDHSLQPIHIQEQALVQAWMQLRCMVKFDKPNKMSPYKSKTPASCNLWIGRLGFTIKISVYNQPLLFMFLFRIDSAVHNKGK